MTAAHPASIPAETLLRDCEVRFDRRSGPGGQNRNKVETAAILKHKPTGIVAEANERRTQGENRKAALFRLRVALALTIRSEPTDAPSPLWRTRAAGGKLRVNPEHDDFPALLAEALDELAARDWDVKSAAGRLGVSSSQLLKFLKVEPKGLILTNENRRDRGLPALL